MVTHFKYLKIVKRQSIDFLPENEVTFLLDVYGLNNDCQYSIQAKPSLVLKNGGNPFFWQKLRKLPSMCPLSLLTLSSPLPHVHMFSYLVGI